MAPFRRPSDRVPLQQRSASAAAATTVPMDDDPTDAKQPVVEPTTPTADLSRPRNSSKISPDARTNWLSWLFFSWQTPLMRLGYQRTLEMDDMYLMSDEMTADLNCRELQKNWDLEVERFEAAKAARPAVPETDALAGVDAADASKTAGEGTKSTKKSKKPEPTHPSLVRALWETYGIPWALTGIYYAINIASQVASPIVLQYLLEYLAIEEIRHKGLPAPSQWVGRGFLLVLAIFLLQCVATMTNSLFFIASMRIGIQLRSALIAAIYSKSLRLSARARATDFNAGKVTNLIATDTFRIDMFTPYIHVLWTSPLTIIIILALLIRSLGPSALAGFALMAIFTPIQGIVLKRLSVYRKDGQILTDQRVKLINEMLQGVRILKLFGWEEKFVDSIMDVREKELHFVGRLASWRAAINGVAQVIPALAAILVFAVYYATGNELTASVVFSSLALFNQLRLPLMFLPMSLAFVVDSLVASNRIAALLYAEELSSQPNFIDDASAPNAIEIKHADFEWNVGQTQIHRAHLAIPRGKLVAVCGAVGSGKSSLLSGIVGEMRRTSGSVTIAGRMGYCPQQPWIQNATLRDNVLFGLPYNAERYQRAIKLASLERDLRQLDDSDQTEIGEKGINLSGGQKARVNLARAIYFDPDIFLLDDPLSAVDAHVGGYLFNETIAGRSARKELSCFVTHALTFVPKADSLFRVGNDLWLAAWTGRTFELSQGAYLGIYFMWGVLQAVSYVINGMQVAYAGVRAGRSLHHAALLKIMRSPMVFFETTPLGRIINRFSKDQDAMDNTLPDSGRMFLGTLAMTLSTFVVMIVSTPPFAGPLVPLLVLYWFAQKFYRASSREFKRLDSLSRSPLYSQFSESLTGIVTIRAYREQSRFAALNRVLIDNNNRPIYMQTCAQRWLSLRIEMIGNFLVFFAGLFGVTANGSISASLIGLSLSYALQITGVLNWCVRQAAEVEIQMNSVERLDYYAEHLESEAPPVTDVRPAPEWPAHGEIELKNVTMAYRADLDPVLKNVSLKIPAGFKAGIVGRTGAGKSTLIVALFRLVELREGSITVDGMDISQLGLADLRQRLSIIPQDPVLFAGSVRSNLDRFGTASDAVLWECLERAGLKNYVQSLDGKLDASVAENGEDMSVGQRQLMCLARAMVKQSKILIMDEATASVDLETDALIQKAIRRDFAGATVITIAHRLNTIIDYDMIVQMDHGRVAECGTPAELLTRPDSMFAALVDETGPTNAALLRRLAVERRLELA
ncbi:hypothetical protein AMAG_02600 [Allomyces macrogynus ATCC 38327]|uniref:P-loop containing nucleoside triphosphate hydrolase protein n=1 Tax=Allomyces macrogynus (strain ATCC 38327) TaxID=578462 RepID=A0A0L0S337_ALLM3|nr:hypothetical protein AMAG_02600 [Allomyces macrogynus ATCC 38327]|eukprot:KNE56826.1 hypothetical protein AMAG_02600 [Allomyces macrogynus ATCC 38327]